VSNLDLRVGALSITGTPGTSKTLVTTWTDSDGDPYDLTGTTVSLWTGGNRPDPTDFTDATETVGVIASNTATFSFMVPDDRTLLRLTLDGALLTIGQFRPSTRGANNPTDEVAVNVGSVSLAITLDGSAAIADLSARLTALEAVAVTDP
jgi:hypothetical protein